MGLRGREQLKERIKRGYKAIARARAQVKQDDPGAITYTVDEMMELIRLEAYTRRLKPYPRG